MGRFYEKVGKRALDITVGGAVLFASTPLLAGVAIAVAVVHGRPVLFRQQRPGLHGEPFLFLKFRSMSHATDDEGRLLPDVERLTSLGKLLRATSLDELPQLLNVLKGEMSLVGPRPLLMQYLERYSSEQARRHDVKPGITGWAQVNGRNALSWEEKFAHDVWYVDNVSLKTDLEILFRTALKVVRREGISAGNHATMPEFLGTEKS